MRFIKVLAMVVCILVMPSIAKANIYDNYKEARIEYISALVSLAAYSDRLGVIAREELAEAGWFMRPYNKNFAGVDARFFIVENDEIEPGREIYILAVTGTESVSDVKVDINFNKVFFGGNNPQQFIKEAEKKNLTSQDPMVHRGFNRYAQTAFFFNENNGKTLGEHLVNILKERPNRLLYMSGHSLGGAVATLAAARLIAMGAPADQIKVISFGAPAIGNETFAREYGDQINLDRIVIAGDPIRGVLQSISGGYMQFGKYQEWQDHRNELEKSHSIAVYTDAALRNYYDARSQLNEYDNASLSVKLAANPNNLKVYVAPIAFAGKNLLNGDEYYMQMALDDFAQRTLPGAILGKQRSSNLSDELAQAATNGCQWLIMPSVNVQKMRNKQDTLYIDYVEEVYEVASGELKSGISQASSTYQLTPIQAILYGSAKARETCLKTIGAL